MTSISGAPDGNGVSASAAGRAPARCPRKRMPAVRAATLAMALGVLSACSGSASHSLSPAPGQAEPVQARAGIPSSLLGAGWLDFTLPATGAEFTAGAEFIGEVYALRDQMTSMCMTRSGFHVPATPASAYASYYAGSSQFPDLARIARTGNFGPVAPIQPPAVRIPAGQRQRFGMAMDRCRAAAAKPLSAFPGASVPLTKLWISRVLRIQGSAKVRQAWAGARSCFERAGTPAAYAGSFETFFAYEGSLGLKADSSQASVLRVDEHWAPVFLRCAAPVVKVQEPLQSAQRTLFIQQHYQQVRHLEAVAARMVARYRRAAAPAGPR